MSHLKGVYPSVKHDGTLYFRASITYKNKHISLGSFKDEQSAHQAYLDANDILLEGKHNYDNYTSSLTLSFEKWIVLHNFRDNGYYIKNPIYMHKYYFSYFIDPSQELLFDVDDLFYYSTHKIFKRMGYLFVNDFGIQSNILQRFGIKNFSVEGRDFYFKDGNSYNMRYHNIVVINKYYGVEKVTSKGKDIYVTKIHINGNFIVGKYTSEEKAAIAFNKAADYLKHYKITNKLFPRNYLDNVDKTLYDQIYQKIKLPYKILHLKPYIPS
ncbi:MAG: hypothetical protein CVU84_12385 [Firmicutes bacterium HGW-Firmicutes-1]|jgi:hypothetical protein|nr:MAG: hypothetical protein CVU84_12385 [Firmicutes bacterium HGW-Firmicutes-1]